MHRWEKDSREKDRKLDIGKLVFVINFVSTLFMFGLIWFIQLVHYPLFNKISRDEETFVSYQKWHQYLTTVVVGPAMVLEGFSAVFMLYYIPADIPPGALLAGVALVLTIWISTMMFQIPCHGKLLKSFDNKAYRRLVTSNWIRTVAWSCRAALVVWIMWEMLPATSS